MPKSWFFFSRNNFPVGLMLHSILHNLRQYLRQWQCPRTYTLKKVSPCRGDNKTPFHDLQENNNIIPGISLYISKPIFWKSHLHICDWTRRKTNIRKVLLVLNFPIFSLAYTYLQDLWWVDSIWMVGAHQSWKMCLKAASGCGCTQELMKKSH